MGSNDPSKSTPRTPHVLFVCVQNAGRSQMAAAFLDHLAGGRATATSAGSRPAEKIHDGVAEAMAEVGISMGGAVPKALHPDMVAEASVIVTMGCGDACPVLPGRDYEDWELPDPSGMSSTDLRSVRDMIRVRVQDLLVRLES